MPQLIGARVREGENFVVGEDEMKPFLEGFGGLTFKLYV